MQPTTDRPLSPHEWIAICDFDRKETVLISMLADVLLVPVNRFRHGKHGLSNTYYEDGFESDMYWAWQRRHKTEHPPIKYLLNERLNKFIIQGDPEKLIQETRAWEFQSLDFDCQELILNAIDTWTKWMHDARKVHIEDDAIHIPKRKGHGYLIWPITMVKEAGFDYWWKNAGSLEADDRQAIHNLLYAPHPK